MKPFAHAQMLLKSWRLSRDDRWYDASLLHLQSTFGKNFTSCQKNCSFHERSLMPSISVTFPMKCNRNLVVFKALIHKQKDALHCLQKCKDQHQKCHYINKKRWHNFITCPSPFFFFLQIVRSWKIILWIAETVCLSQTHFPMHKPP